MLRYSVPDALRTVYGTVEYGAEQQVARACVLVSGTCMRMNQEGGACSGNAGARLVVGVLE